PDIAEGPLGEPRKRRAEVAARAVTVRRVAALVMLSEREKPAEREEAAADRRIRPNHISAASAARTTGTSTAPHPSHEKIERRHHERSGAFGSAKSATSERIANAARAIAATSLRMRASSA